MDFDQLNPKQRKDFDDWRLGTDISQAKYIYTKPDYLGMRTISFREPGLFWLSRRHCGLNAIEVKSAGGWGRILLMDGFQRWRFFMPSSFTGSFYFSPSGWFDSGMLIHQDCGMNTPPFLTLSWRELERPDSGILEPSVEILPWGGPVVNYNQLGAVST